MAEKKKIYPNPRFNSVLEEDKYWATHSPLDEGYPSEIQQEKQKHSSFLTIRLTGEELTQLRDISSSKGMGPSTYIRTLIKEALSPRDQAELALNEGAQRFQSVIQDLVYDKIAGERSAVKDKAKEQYKAFDEAFYILQLSRSSLTQEKIHDLIAAIVLNIVDQLIANTCVKVITPVDNEFDKMQRLIKVGSEQRSTMV